MPKTTWRRAIPRPRTGGATIAPLRSADGRPLPFIADNNMVVFQALDTGTGTVTSWYADMREAQNGAVKFDEFSLGGL